MCALIDGNRWFGAQELNLSQVLPGDLVPVYCHWTPEAGPKLQVKPLVLGSLYLEACMKLVVAMQGKRQDVGSAIGVEWKRGLATFKQVE